MTHHACDLCQTDAPRPLPQDPRISVCGSCGFVYVPERRSSAEIAASWGEIYSSGQYDPNWPAVKARLYYVAEWIDQNIGLAGKELLDVGAGKGQFMRECSRRGAKPFGIEPALEGSYIRQHAIEDGPLGEQFDVVTMTWTLENSGDCLAMLRFAREHCKPDGWVVVATGSRILVPFKKPLSSYLNPNIPADLHCFRWTFTSLSNAMRRAGIASRKANPYRECDWLVMAGIPAEPQPKMAGRDDPFAVEYFFADWEIFTERYKPDLGNTTWSLK